MRRKPTHLLPIIDERDRQRSESLSTIKRLLWQPLHDGVDPALGSDVMYRKILVPLDGSPTAARGLDEALALANTTGASLVLLHVIDAFPFAVETATSATWEALMEGLRQQGRSLLQRSLQQALERGVAATEHLVEFPQGRVADAILDEAEQSGCDLIVMGTHGRRGFRHALLGSDAERVLRQSPKPVLTVRQPEAARP